MTLQSFLNSRNFYEFEGYCHNKNQIKDLIFLTSKPSINVMEIGFNAGHSAEIFLENNKNLKLTSFDLGKYDYTSIGKQYLDLTYPNRHTLILGDSTLTVPDYIKNNHTKFDVIFIDGGHDYNIANADLENCFQLAHRDTIVILDDTMYSPEWKHFWNDGPTKAWTECLFNNKITQIDKKDYQSGIGMSWGKFNLD